MVWVQMHYYDIIMGAIASQITSLTIVYSTISSDADQSKHQSSASLAFVWGIHRGPVKFPHKWPVTRKMFPFDDVIMVFIYWQYKCIYIESYRKMMFFKLPNSVMIQEHISRWNYCLILHVKTRPILKNKRPYWRIFRHCTSLGMNK